MSVRSSKIDYRKLSTPVLKEMKSHWQRESFYLRHMPLNLHAMDYVEINTILDRINKIEKILQGR